MTTISKISSIKNFAEYSIFFFNSINFISGTTLFSYYIKNVSKDNNYTIIENCDNIFLIDFLGIINSFVVFLIITNLFEFKLLAFLCNITLSCYNYYHLHEITQKCVSYYNEITGTINYVSIYFLYNILVQSVTNLLFIVIICLFIRYNNTQDIKKKETIKENETLPLINNSNNLYPNLNYGDDNLYDDIDINGDT